MDQDNSPPALNCFICAGLDTPAQRLRRTTSKECSTYLQQSEAIKNLVMVKQIKENYAIRELSYAVKT